MSGGTHSTPSASELKVVREAQDQIAAALPEIDKLAWRLFAIARDLDAPLDDDEDFREQEPGPTHLRYFVALGAMAGYTALLETIGSLRGTAEQTDFDIRQDWWRGKQLRENNKEEGNRPITDTVLAELRNEFAKLVHLLLANAQAAQKPTEENDDEPTA